MVGQSQYAKDAFNNLMPVPKQLETGDGQFRLDENFSIAVSSDEGNLQRLVQADLGAMHGLKTLLQLLSANSEGYYFPAVNVDDSPRFPGRGLMIDSARHFMPLHVIRRNIDGMAALKLNVLHWHLTEDQGFRVKVNSYPRLHKMGTDGL